MKKILAYLFFLYTFSTNAQVNHISFNATCDFISRGKNGLLLFGTTEDYFTYNGSELTKKSLSLEGSHNIQSKIYQIDDSTYWFTTYDGLVKQNIFSDASEKFQIKIGGLTNKSDYYLFAFDTIKSLIWLKQGEVIYTFNLKNYSFTKIFDNILGRRILYSDLSNLNRLFFSFYHTFQPGILEIDSEGNSKMSYWNKWPDSTIANDMFWLNEHDIFIITNNGFYIGDIKNNSISKITLPLETKYMPLCGTLIDKDKVLVSFGKGGLFTFQNINSLTDLKVTQIFTNDIKNPINRISKVDSNVIILSSYDKSIYFYNTKKIKFRLYEWPERIEWGIKTDEKFIFHYENNKDTILYINGLASTPLTNKTNSNYKLMGNTNNKFSYILKSINFPFYNKLVFSKYNSLFNDKNVYRTLNFSKDNYLFSKDNSLYSFTKNGFTKECLDFNLDKTINYYFDWNNTNTIIGINEELITVYNRNNGKKLFESNFSGDIFSQVVKDNDIYFATTQGVFTMKMQTFKFSKSSFQDKSISKVCNCITEDKLGWIWASGSDYLFKFSKDTVIYYQFTDGFNKSKFIPNGCGSIYNNLLYFIQEKGLVIINPEELIPFKEKGFINFNSLKVNNLQKQFKYGKNNFPSLEANFKDYISFNIVSNDLASPELTRIKYNLSNLNDNWINSNSNNVSFQYPNLLPGKYELKIKCFNSDNIENNEPSILHLNILPPYWQTWWFRLIILITTILIVYKLIQAYYNRQLEKRDILLREQSLIIDKQEAVEKERTRIASEMHDDLGSGLTTIRYLSDRALKNVNNEAEKSQIEKIADQSNALIRNMSEIIWAMNSRFDTLENLISYIRRYSSEYLEEYKIQLEWTQSEINSEAKLNGEKRRNVFLVVKEALHNIVKHSQANQVKIEIQGSADHVEILIRDNGIGFDLNGSKSQGNGLFNMQKRMQIIGGSYEIKILQPGTQICLTFETNDPSDQK